IAWLALLGPAAWLIVRGHTVERAHGDGLSLATVGFLGAAVLQGKGWNYHYAPAVTTGLLLLALVAAQRLRPLVLLMRFVTAAILFGFVRQAWLGYRRPAGDNPDVVDARTYQRLVHELGDAGHPRAMLALYRHSGQAFALTTFGGVRFVSPFPMIWVLDAPGWKTKLPWWIDQILRAAMRDPPDLILLSRDPVDGSRTFDQLFISNPGIAALLSHYKSRPD